MVYSFMATASGPASTTSMGDWNGQNFNIALSGNGRGAQFVITPTSLDFGPVQVGSSAPSQTVTVTNVGPSPVVMSGAGGGGGSDRKSVVWGKGVDLGGRRIIEKR